MVWAVTLKQEKRVWKTMCKFLMLLKILEKTLLAHCLQQQLKLSLTPLSREL